MLYVLTNHHRDQVSYILHPTPSLPISTSVIVDIVLVGLPDALSPPAGFQIQDMSATALYPC